MQIRDLRFTFAKDFNLFFLPGDDDETFFKSANIHNSLLLSRLFFLLFPGRHQVFLRVSAFFQPEMFQLFHGKSVTNCLLRLGQKKNDFWSARKGKKEAIN